jgi:uncharacterized protein (TIGR02271 family)
MVDQAKPSVGKDTVTIPVHQEELHVGTRTVDTGAGVRIHTSVTERPVAVDQAVRHDELSVTRVPIDRIVAAGDTPVQRYEGDTLIIPVLEEVLVIERRVRIKEELHITKTQRETHHTETVLLKSEHVSVERFDDATDP